ncbi:MAG: hypothetical protein SVV80_11410 [Planctomycetota bacterium]|nr:hypothetical protein [Planctomycetota bacterium]
MRKFLLTALLPSAMFFIGGCNLGNWFMHVFAPPIPMKTIEAQFGDLPGKTVAVVVFAGPEIQLDYNMAQLELTDAVGAELRRKVRNVTLIDARRVIRYQAENVRWDAMPPENLCDVFGADYVMLISLMEFSTREQGSIHLARGRITAEINIYKAKLSSTGGGNPVWRTGPIYTVYPAESSMGMPAGNDLQIRILTERIFAAELVKNFHEYKVPKES